MHYTLTRGERAWLVSQLVKRLLPVYGPFPLPETRERHKQLSLSLNCRRITLREKIKQAVGK